VETTNLTRSPDSDKPLVLVLNQQAKYFLHTAGKWASFLGKLGFVTAILIAISAFFVGPLFSVMARFDQVPQIPWIGGITGFVAIVVAIFYFYFSFYLYRFGRGIKRGVTFQSEAEVASALGKLKAFFKLWGITTIVLIALYIMIIVALVAAGPALQQAVGTNSAIS